MIIGRYFSHFVVIQLKESFLLAIVGIYLIIGPNFGTVFAEPIKCQIRRIKSTKMSDVTSIAESTIPPASITVDLNRVRFEIGESVHIFGKAYSERYNSLDQKSDR